jgi:hypothetical protein
MGAKSNAAVCVYIFQGKNWSTDRLLLKLGDMNQALIRERVYVHRVTYCVARGNNPCATVTCLSVSNH